MKNCFNQKIVNDQFICVVREEFDGELYYCQFVGKEEQCPKYSKMLNDAK